MPISVHFESILMGTHRFDKNLVYRIKLLIVEKNFLHSQFKKNGIYHI